MKQTLHWNRSALLASPLYQPLQPILQRLADGEFPTPDDCNRLLDNQPITVQIGLPLCFIAQQSGKPSFESQYEPRCYLRGEVQMRERNWHDLFNALVWMTFPRMKAAANARHYLAMTAGAQDSSRGAARDMATLFDESGVIVVCADAALGELLKDFQWRELFWQRRAQVKAGMDFYIFGHGLYEKALHPYTGMTGQGLILPVEQEFFSQPLAQRLMHLDKLLADYLLAPQHCRSPRELSPVPLLGLPGWTVQNECAEYYANAAYFRPGRRADKISEP
ncbi:MAG: DUF3025 domain-containing protein [Pseudomonadota bacterium]